MLRDLKKCSIQYIQEIFKSLDEFTDYVFWIRNHDTSKQYFTSPNFSKIWQRDVAILYELPYLFIDYLAKDNDYTYFRQFQARHDNQYTDAEKNIILYQVSTPSGEIRYLLDRCYRCYSPTGVHYALGVSKNISAEIWHQHYRERPDALDKEDEKAYRHFFRILKSEFGILPFKPELTQLAVGENLSEGLSIIHQFKLSKRELECLHHFCDGKSYKQAANEMSISPRTVETYLENILNKTACASRLEVISRFSRYFS